MDETSRLLFFNNMCTFVQRIFPYRMPISMAERTLSRAIHLEEFCLVGVNLSATTSQDFDDFSETLRQHPSLKSFGLDNCRLKDESTGPTLDDAIVNVLVQIPTLEKVVIRAMEVSMWGTLSCSSVGLLCASSTLKSLELFVFSSCKCSFMVDMAKSLIQSKDTTQLEELSISGCLGGMNGARAISDMLLVNQKLKSLELHLRSRTEDDEDGIIELSKALTKNKTLTKFQLHASTNKSGSWETRNAFLKMLQSNYTLSESVLVFHPGFLRPDNEFYLKLNQVGRGYLLENTELGKEVWVETLIKVRWEVDCLFYFLTTNPSLCASSLLDDASVVVKSSDDTGEYSKRKRKWEPSTHCEALANSSSAKQPPALLMPAS